MFVVRRFCGLPPPPRAAEPLAKQRINRSKNSSHDFEVAAGTVDAATTNSSQQSSRTHRTETTFVHEQVFSGRPNSHPLRISIQHQRPRRPPLRAVKSGFGAGTGGGSGVHSSATNRCKLLALDSALESERSHASLATRARARRRTRSRLFNRQLEAAVAAAAAADVAV